MLLEWERQGIGTKFWWGNAMEVGHFEDEKVTKG
jgi:hypothetical protein